MSNVLTIRRSPSWLGREEVRHEKRLGQTSRDQIQWLLSRGWSTFSDNIQVTSDPPLFYAILPRSLPPLHTPPFSSYCPLLATHSTPSFCPSFVLPFFSFEKETAEQRDRVLGYLDTSLLPLQLSLFSLCLPTILELILGALILLMLSKHRRLASCPSVCPMRVFAELLNLFPAKVNYRCLLTADRLLTQCLACCVLATDTTILGPLRFSPTGHFLTFR